jgi:hypothetical protein
MKMSKKNFIMTDVMSEYHIPDRKIIEVYAGYDLSHNIGDHRIIINYTDDGEENELVIFPGYFSDISSINVFIKSKSKEVFIDLMSKLYDMAEVE